MQIKCLAHGRNILTLPRIEGTVIYLMTNCSKFIIAKIAQCSTQLSISDQFLVHIVSPRRLFVWQDTQHAEDSDRRFIISYRLADDMLTIYEPRVRNSGVIGGKFLERTRVTKPNRSPDAPEYYGPQDFYIGAVIEIFNHRFVITGADAFVLSYMEEHANQFPGD